MNIWRVWIAALLAVATAAHGAEVRGPARIAVEAAEDDLEAWDTAGAKAAVQELAGTAPANSSPIAYLNGRIAFEEGRYADAAADLSSAGNSDKATEWRSLAEATAKVLEGTTSAESEHFVVVYKPGPDEILVSWTLDALEAQRAALHEDLGYAPPGKTRVEIVGSAADLSTLSTLNISAIRTTGTVAICKFNKLMVLSPRVILTGYDWMDTVAHEYTHLVVSKKSRNRVPIWMHEGLAKYLETRWRGPAGKAMTPSSLALLGERVRKSTLIPFSKMHPSMALLPTAEDAAVAFSEVFYAIQLVHRLGGKSALSEMLTDIMHGASDKEAVKRVTRLPWPSFEKSWMTGLQSMHYPSELVPRSSNERKELAANDSPKNAKGREISFGDFAEVSEPGARRDAHLAEILRERDRMGASAEVYERTWKQVGNRYESISNKYALTLLELKRYSEAEKVLVGSLELHPGSASTNVHLGRLRIRSKSWIGAKAAYLDALAVNPFDPEVQVGLYTAARQLHDERLAERAEKAARLLLGSDHQSFLGIARRFSGLEDLSRVDEALTPNAQEVLDGGAKETRSFHKVSE